MCECVGQVTVSRLPLFFVAFVTSFNDSLFSFLRLLSDNLPRITKLIETSNDVLPSESLSEEEDSSNDQKADEKDLRGANVPTPPDSAIVIAQEEVRYLESEKENLSKTIEELQEKLKKTEQNKEHWKLEFQLLQMKHDKVKSNLDHLSLTNSSGEMGSDEAPDENSRKVIKKKTLIPSFKKYTLLVFAAIFPG